MEPPGAQEFTAPHSRWLIVMRLLEATVTLKKFDAWIWTWTKSKISDWSIGSNPNKLIIQTWSGSCITYLVQFKNIHALIPSADMFCILFGYSSFKKPNRHDFVIFIIDTLLILNIGSVINLESQWFYLEMNFANILFLFNVMFAGDALCITFNLVLGSLKRNVCFFYFASFLLSSRKIHDITLTGWKNERQLQPNAPASRIRYINIHLIFTLEYRIHVLWCMI